MSPRARIGLKLLAIAASGQLISAVLLVGFAGHLPTVLAIHWVVVEPFGSASALQLLAMQAIPLALVVALGAVGATDERILGVSGPITGGMAGLNVGVVVSIILRNYDAPFWTQATGFRAFHALLLPAAGILGAWAATRTMAAKSPCVLRVHEQGSADGNEPGMEVLVRRTRSLAALLSARDDVDR